MIPPIAILVSGPRSWASSRFRGYWLEDAAPDLFQVYQSGDDVTDLADHRMAVFQKRQSEADYERARRLKDKGVKVVYDLTDPLWFWNPKEVGRMIALADTVTVSSPGLFEAIKDMSPDKPVFCIEDRMLPAYHPTVRQHEDRSPVVLAWYGMAANRAGLLGALPLIEYLSHSFPLQLRVIDDQPQNQMVSSTPLDIQHVPYAVDSFHHQLVDCDIAVCPPYPGIWGELKSNNKAVSAFWSGLPVWEGVDLEMLAKLIGDHALRQKIATEDRAMAERCYSIDQSVAEWRALLNA